MAAEPSRSAGRNDSDGPHPPHPPGLPIPGRAVSATLLRRLADPGPSGRRRGVTSVCSAHPMVLEAALRHARRRGTPVLIEATCNQVNQDGGYTGMTPADFRDFVAGLAADAGSPAGA